MNSGICVCVLLATLSSSGCLGLPARPPKADAAQVLPEEHARHARSAPPSGQNSPFSKAAEEELDPHVSINQLLARLISRKGSYRRNSVLASRASGPAAGHRIKDRDYMGWMDFGRRSAEEYEYSS
ncbi:cholecystokinin-like [Denticeps clupeoides]|uniref:Gastrin/cholecystokinin peptide hormone domain-containing protein n=1 Tax=Denticeps clupeoides TaxID=299321 RepID=A0AAY4D6Y6_9TELE|nr:cholecystokinin-like [Denticeps clupeoides]